MSSATPLLRLEPPILEPLERMRRQALALAPADGHTSVLFPHVCVYRFSAPTAVRKASTFGVTLCVALQGTKEVRIGKHAFTIDPWRLLVITRETEHQGMSVSAGADGPSLGVAVCFRPEQVARALLALAEAGGTAEGETAPGFVMPCCTGIAGALERLLDLVHDPLDAKLLAPLVIEEILFRLLRSDAAAAVRSAVGQPADARRILDTMQYIRQHHTEKLNVAALARRSAMSASHFAHRFSAVARMSPMRYLREVRLERARALLLDQGARVSEVASEVGFESPAHFAREFKRRFGVSPSRTLSTVAAAQ